MGTDIRCRQKSVGACREKIRPVTNSAWLKVNALSSIQYFDSIDMKGTQCAKKPAPFILKVLLKQSETGKPR